MELEAGDEVLILPCKHFYHPTCITQWLLINKVCGHTPNDANGLALSTLMRRKPLPLSIPEYRSICIPQWLLVAKLRCGTVQTRLSWAADDKLNAEGRISVVSCRPIDDQKRKRGRWMHIMVVDPAGLDRPC